MRDGTTVNQRDVVLLPFPYSDLSLLKQRPAIVLSNKKYNTYNQDVICCAITSNPDNYANSIKIEPKDFENGELPYESTVKPNKIFTLKQSSIIKKFGRLNIPKSKEVVKNLKISIEIED
jgi:mRNA interferase MazF